MVDPRFVGREREQRSFQRLLDNPYGDERLQFIWGPGGIGKTWLMRTMLANAREHEKYDYHAPDKVVDTYSTDSRHIEGIIETIIALLQLPSSAFTAYHTEKAKLNSARHQEGYAQAGLEAQLNALAIAFRNDLQQVIQQHPVVLAFDTFEHVQDTPVGRWILSEDGLQVPGLLCIVAGRKPNPLDPNQPPLAGLNDEEAFSLDNEYFPNLWGERGEEDRAYAARLNKLAGGNPLLLGLALFWLNVTDLFEEEWEALTPAEFQRRIASWLSPTGANRGGALFPGIPSELGEPLRQTLVCMAYLNRRFNRTLLERLVQARYVRGAGTDELWDVLTGKSMPEFFYVKERPEGEIQLHDKLAEMLRLNVLPDAFDDVTGERVREFATDVVGWYDDLIAQATDGQQKAILQAEKLAYALRQDVLADVQQPEWIDTPEAERLAQLLPPDFATAKGLLIEYRRQHSDVLNRLVVNELRPEVIALFPLADRYDVCSILGEIAREAYLLEDSTAYWEYAFQVAEATNDVTKQVSALNGEANATWQRNPRYALAILERALDLCPPSSPQRSEILHGIAFICRRLHDLEQAMHWYSLAGENAQSHNKESQITATILADMGYALVLMGEYAQAKAHLDKALELRKLIRTRLQKRSNELAIDSKKKKVNTAVAEQQVNDELREAKLRVGMTYNLLGQLARQNPNDIADATGYYREALSIFNELDNPYWEAVVLQAQGDANRRYALSLYYKEQPGYSAEYDKLAYQNISTSLEICERYGFVDLLPTVRRRMGRLMHDRALRSVDNTKRQIELIHSALTHFEAGIRDAEATNQTDEELENAVEIAFLADDLLRLKPHDSVQTARYIHQLEARIERHESDNPRIYHFLVYKDLLAIEWGAFFYEQRKFGDALTHYLTGFTGLASDPAYGSARCKAHIGHLFTNIHKLEDRLLRKEWYSSFLHKWRSTSMKHGKKQLISEAHPELTAKFEFLAGFE